MHPVSPGSPSDDADPLATGAGPPRYRDAFAVADELAVHGSDCVCPICAGRLTGLLNELAQAIRRDSTD
jgi:hypothetical protein